jgi:predicted Zn-dependent protease
MAIRSTVPVSKRSFRTRSHATRQNQIGGESGYFEQHRHRAGKKGNLTGALDYYDQAAKTDVTNVVFQRNSALLLCKMGRPQEAIRCLRDILSLDSDDAKTLQILAVANELAAGDLAKKRTLPAAEASH